MIRIRSTLWRVLVSWRDCARLSSPIRFWASTYRIAGVGSCCSIGVRLPAGTSCQYPGAASGQSRTTGHMCLMRSCSKCLAVNSRPNLRGGQFMYTWRCFSCASRLARRSVPSPRDACPDWSSGLAREAMRVNGPRIRPVLKRNCLARGAPARLWGHCTGRDAQASDHTGVGSGTCQLRDRVRHMRTDPRETPTCPARTRTQEFDRRQKTPSITSIRWYLAAG